MVFKRRSPRSGLQWLKNLAYPDGGWQRAGSYVWHRLHRLPDTPERIARGIAVGVFISFTPLFGFHLLLATGLAWVVRGNVLAALLGTFFGNPFTFPLILVSAFETGSMILGQGHMVTAHQVAGSIKGVWQEIVENTYALFTSDPILWDQSRAFFGDVFLPYMLGGTIAGSVAAMTVYIILLPIIRAYHARRQRKKEDRSARARRAAQKARGMSKLGN